MNALLSAACIIASMTAPWVHAEGEEARLIPGVPEMAEIASRGRLPFRPRSEGSFRLRAPCSGTAVVLGNAMFEVLEERLEDQRAVYRLRPWQDNEIVRGLVVYDDAFVRGIRAERQRARVREWARPFRLLLYPLVGSLPEAAQERLSERYGLYAVRATLSSALSEFLACVLLAVGGAKAGGVMHSFAMVLGAPGLVMFPALALGRAFSALTLRETEGQWCIVLAAELLGPLFRRPPRKSWRPLSRERFWALLDEPDQVLPDEDGTALVRSALPHVSWTRERRALVDGVQWEVQPLPVHAAEEGPIFAYRLVPPAGGEAVVSPDSGLYARSVRRAIDPEWDDFLVGFRGLVSCLPESVQRRAVGRNGGAQVLRSSVFRTSGFVGCAGFFVLYLAVGAPGADPLAPWLGALGVLLALDSGWRAIEAQVGMYAPSVLRFVIPRDLLRPERVQFHSHRDAWREAAEQVAACGRAD